MLQVKSVAEPVKDDVQARRQVKEEVKRKMNSFLFHLSYLMMEGGGGKEALFIKAHRL